ncbi:hypothetical protein Fmac_029152 [Flemingia macrophylla]|uniref:Uncharacterized protein n=1 Tax=Flemingia macrophylla TaxID=520843 RepID=A0ABD1L9V6_9FABA
MPTSRASHSLIIMVSYSAWLLEAHNQNLRNRPSMAPTTPNMTPALLPESFKDPSS